jgi:hypothetical protein
VSDITGREVLLDKARELVMGDRNKVYDDPVDNFGRIVDLWSVYLDSVGDRELEPHDVAILNVLQKVARIAYTPDHADSWVDIAGYAACGWDCVVDESFVEPEPDYSVLNLDRVLYKATDETGVLLYWINTNSPEYLMSMLSWFDGKRWMNPPTPGGWVVEFDSEPGDLYVYDYESFYDNFSHITY